MSVIFRIKAPSRQADVAMWFITHITEECTNVAGWRQPGDCAFSSLRLIIRGPRQRQHGFREHKPTCGWSYITSVCTCRRKRSRSSHRTRSHFQKEIRREIKSIPKTIHIPSGQGLPGKPSSWVVEEPCIDPTEYKW